MKKVMHYISLFIINNFLKGTRFFKVKNRLLKICGVKVGADTKIVGPIEFGTQIKITIGDKCWIGKNLSIDGNGYCNIGNNVDIGPHVVINTGGHEIGFKERRAGKGIINSIIIQDGTWIGTKTTIINDINIGKGVVIAAGSLVNRDVKANVMAAGVPITVKKELEEIEALND